ncbi:MAG: TolC family protein, partial [Methylophilaceae bacterium]|nr:TolC family protein [Methylophilaceae bacterium]
MLKILKSKFSMWAMLLAATLLASQSVVAAENDHDDVLLVSQNLTLRDLIAKTIQRYPDSVLLQAKQIEIDARSKHAKGLLPNAPAIGLMNQNDVITSNRGERNWEAEFEMPIWLPGQRAAREAIARDAAAGLIDARETLQLQVAGLVRDALWDIAMMMHQATLAKSRHETALALLNDVEKRVKAGDALT